MAADGSPRIWRVGSLSAAAERARFTALPRRDLGAEAEFLPVHAIARSTAEPGDTVGRVEDHHVDCPLAHADSALGLAEITCERLTVGPAGALREQIVHFLAPRMVLDLLPPKCGCHLPRARKEPEQ